MWGWVALVAVAMVLVVAIGAVFKLLIWGLIIGSVVIIGWSVFAAVTERKGPEALR